MKFTKLGTKRTAGLHEPWVSSFLSDHASVSSYFVTTKDPYITPTAHSPLPRSVLSKSSRAKPRLVLSKSMEKAFRKYMAKPSARHAFVEAEVATSIALQIRAIRIQRGWTQGELAKKLETTQAAVSRLEDPSYGRLSIKTLVQLANVFDAGLSVDFIPFVSMVCDNWTPHKHLRKIDSFEKEAHLLAFECDGPQVSYVIHLPEEQSSFEKNSMSIPSTAPVASKLLINL